VISLLRSCVEQRQSMMFRSAHFCKELEAFAGVMRFLALAYQQVRGD
jgi:hypothetical protein